MSPISLSNRRARKAAAKAYHPSVWPIWTPADAAETIRQANNLTAPVIDIATREVIA